MNATVNPLLVPDPATDHILGPADARVTLIEYGDFECPSCAQAAPAVKILRDHFGRQVRFVFRHFPLVDTHPNAMHAAQAAESVASQAGEEGFWRMHDYMYDHQRDGDDSLDDGHLVRYADRAGADAAVVALDLAGGEYESLVTEDIESGIASGVRGTPTFFVNGRKFDGDWAHADAFTDALERAAT